MFVGSGVIVGISVEVGLVTTMGVRETNGTVGVCVETIGWLWQADTIIHIKEKIKTHEREAIHRSWVHTSISS